MALSVCSSVFAQTSFKTEIKSIFLNMPIDSGFEKLSTYALQNRFTDLGDKSKDSSEVFYINCLGQTKLYDIPSVSTCICIIRSDSVFSGDSAYKKSYKIIYRIKLPDYKSWKKVYDKLILKFSKICGTGRLSKEIYWSGTYGGMKFYPESFYPTFFINYGISYHGNTITITYLKTENPGTNLRTICDLPQRGLME